MFAACLLSATPVLGQTDSATDDQSASETATSGTAAESSEPISAQETAELRDRIRKLEQKLETLSQKQEDEELAAIIREAETEAEAPTTEEKPEEREFLWGALALQKLNPEISIGGDVLTTLVLNEDKFYAAENDRSGFTLRSLGIHVQHQLDPYSLFKGAIEFSPFPGADGEAVVGLEELYATWSGLIPSTSLTVGAFRQNFGIVNRWHEHDLDQVHWPLAMQQVIGSAGMAQTGVSFKWFMPPLIAHANELTLEVTNGENSTLFAGEFFSVPAVLGHLKNYYDLSDSTYLEFGLTGMFGFNNRRGFYRDPDHPTELSDEPWRRTIASGADLTVHWSPPQQARYRSLTWRTEGYYVNKMTPEDIDDGIRHAWGLYSYLQYQLDTSLFTGLRFDVALPTFRAEDTYAWDVVPYLTYWQSEFVFIRLEYAYGENIPQELPDGNLTRRPLDGRVTLQVSFAAGPHKHEKY